MGGSKNERHLYLVVGEQARSAKKLMWRRESSGGLPVEACIGERSATEGGESGRAGVSERWVLRIGRDSRGKGEGKDMAEFREWMGKKGGTSYHRWLRQG